MHGSCLALVLAFAVCGQAAVLRGHAESISLQLEESHTESGDSAILSEASKQESEDRAFLLSQIDQTESELKKLQILAAPVEKKAAVVAKPVDKKAAPVAKKEVVTQVVKTPVKEVAKTAKTSAKEDTKAAPVAKKEVVTQVAKTPVKEVAKIAKTSAKKDTKDMDTAKLAKEIGMPNMPSLSSVKGLKGAMALAPMLAMLKGLYEDSKDRISQQNVREEKSKKWFAEKEVEHKAKVASIEGKFANHTLSEEFRTNETRDETRYFSYWSRCRERQHRQFHTNLKIQHGMMMKTKKMMDMYEKALSPKADDQAQAKKMLHQQTGMPEIVFLQNDDFDAVRSQVFAFCTESLDEVQKERVEVHKDSELQKQLARDGVTY